MRIAVITDSHANLPALQAALRAIEADGCDAIYHTGDALSIGPHPAECLELLLNTPNMYLLAGNHDGYFVNGIAQPRPDYMTAGEEEHQHWTHAQLAPPLRAVLAQWPYEIKQEFGGAKVLFTHYALDASRRDFKPLLREVTAAALDKLFDPRGVALVFCGHDHRNWDLMGRTRYLNPGSLGCFDRPVARYYLVDFQTVGYRLEHRGEPYDDAALVKGFTERRVPEQGFIRKAFFGGRF